MRATTVPLAVAAVAVLLAGCAAKSRPGGGTVIDRLRERFPTFAAKLESGAGGEIENVEPPASDEDILKLESRLSIPLPQSYKDLLRCARGFWLMDGTVQLGTQHPFFHDSPPLEKLPPRQLKVVEAKGGGWPPPSQGMLCFAEFFMEADGDQVLFDVSRGLTNGEYPVVYYAHENQPPSVRKLADTFEQWLNAFLDYEEFADE